MKTLRKSIRTFFSNIGGFLKGWWHLNISEKDTIYSFYGFGHFDLAKKYADKRFKRNGLLHWVVPSGPGSKNLVVFNTREKNMMQAQNLMSRKVRAYDLMRAAYHTSEQNNKKKK